MSLGLLESVCFEGMGNSQKPQHKIILETSEVWAGHVIFHYSEDAAQKSIEAYH